VPGIGLVKFDISFGGAYYAFVNVETNQLKFSLTPQHSNELIYHGKAIKKAVANAVKLHHPFEKDMEFLYGVIFIGSNLNVPLEDTKRLRNVCIFADGQIDRSPCGTGVSGLAALEYQRGKLQIGDKLIVESILGISFGVEVVRQVKFGDITAIVPRVVGTAHITGRCEWWIDPTDALKDGFLVG